MQTCQANCLASLGWLASLAQVPPLAPAHTGLPHARTHMHTRVYHFNSTHTPHTHTGTDTHTQGRTHTELRTHTNAAPQLCTHTNSTCAHGEAVLPVNASAYTHTHECVTTHQNHTRDLPDWETHIRLHKFFISQGAVFPSPV